jgi:proline iminopeptidase
MMERIESALGKLIRDYETAALPGDDIIPDTKYSITNYIDIEAPSSIIWCYMMQMGCDRGGWYSIDILDNGGVPSTDFLVDGWSERRVGDRISATPTQDEYFEVLKVDFERSFVVGGEREPAVDPYRTTWAFILKPIGRDATTLIVRAKMQSSPAWKEWLLGSLVLPPIHKFMESAQLRNLKAIAERDACARIQEDVTLLNQNL